MPSLHFLEYFGVFSCTQTKKLFFHRKFRTLTGITKIFWNRRQRFIVDLRLLAIIKSALTFGVGQKLFIFCRLEKTSFGTVIYKCKGFFKWNLGSRHGWPSSVSALTTLVYKAISVCAFYLVNMAILFQRKDLRKSCKSKSFCVIDSHRTY